MARKLKVFSADLGFVRAVVAAPSRKAALEAWGVRDDLFARGSAREIMDDDALMEEARACSGEVLRKPIASGADLLAAAKTKGSVVTRASPKAEKPKPSKPAPSRDELDAAEEALKAAEGERSSAIKAFDKEQAALDLRRDAKIDEGDKAVAAGEAALKRARMAYDKALKAWEG